MLHILFFDSLHNKELINGMKSLDGKVLLDKLCISGHEGYLICCDCFKVYFSRISFDESDNFC